MQNGAEQALQQENAADRSGDTGVKQSKTMEFTEATTAEAARARQIGALCWRMNWGRVEVLLVTSRDTGRWVIPKGWPMDGLSDADAATREAWEEAGVMGEARAEPLGAYRYDKRRKAKGPLPCSVTVYPLRVTGLAEFFPERLERQRRWFTAAKAARKVAEPELRQMLEAIGADAARMADRAKPGLDRA
jgi:8-oxo-dGTP pyrophosphatase MutT (NUDIX family)